MGLARSIEVFALCAGLSLVACGGSSGTARAPAPAAAAPAPAPAPPPPTVVEIYEYSRDEVAIPGTDVHVRLMHVIQYQPREELYGPGGGFIERVLPGAILQFRRGDLVEDVNWRAGPNVWNDLAVELSLDGPYVRLTLR